MIELPITTAAAAIFVLALIALTLQVGIKRIQTQVFFGDGGNIDLARRRTAQINFLEHVPIFLIALALCEASGGPEWLVLGAAGSMLAGRTSHALCMLFTNGLGNARAAGMILTFIAHLMTGIYLASISLERMAG
tara:strand:+ start:1358 stop:1762 length:405 start_codon:yes stop_codon:yes gene_type:complete